jgi:cell division protease FtsH
VDDLAKVSDIARAMVTRYGMHESLPNLSLEQEPSPLLPVPGFTAARSYSDHTSQEIDEAVKEIVAIAFKRALEILTRYRETLERAASLLLERETLTESDLKSFASELAPAARPLGLERAA